MCGGGNFVSFDIEKAFQFRELLDSVEGLISRFETFELIHSVRLELLH